MRKFYLLTLTLLLCTMAQAISWTTPQFTTTTYPIVGGEKLYYFYHVGQKQLLTKGATWGTHAALDSTGVDALPYKVLYYEGDGYRFYSEKADRYKMLFRDETGTHVYTDYNPTNSSSSKWSTFWDIIQNGNGTISIRTASNDPAWGNSGSMVTYGQDQYLLGWNPYATDYTNTGVDMGTNQSVYMLFPGIEGYEYEWQFVATDEYDLYLAKLELYAVAEKAEKKGINYKTYNSAYNGSDIDAVKAATSALQALIIESAEQEEEEENEIGDAIFFALDDGTTMVFPKKYIEGRQEKNGLITFSLKGDTTVSIAKGRILSETTEYQGKAANFESFKFNNKFNDQLFTDAEGVIDDVNHKVNVTVGCIGKRLTPSFKLPEGVKAYVGGELQHSKESRLRFEKPVRYTLAYPKQYVYYVKKVKDEEWSIPDVTDDEWISTKVNLTEDMLSTNAPTNHGDYLGNMLDGDHSTIFHSTYGDNMTYPKLNWYEGAYYGDGVSEWPYIQIALPETMSELKFEYTTRKDGGNDYAPLGLILQGSTDGSTWVNVKTFTADADNLPTTKDATYTSPAITWSTSYKHLRLQLTAAQRKNYLVFSEFALYTLTENPNHGSSEPTLVSPAEYKKSFVPYGTDYEVTVDFLTDHNNVPRIDVWFGDKETWTSSQWIGQNDYKDANQNGRWIRFYEDATIKIDGAGVYPDMAETKVKIKGRGNSSWSASYSSKNPYRLKFSEKKKPLGMTNGKSWVLLANKQTGSMTTNALAMKVADMVETKGCNHIVPVELYINNQYRGSYNFTEKAGFGNNSIELDSLSKANDRATLIELDSYYDEPYKFRDDSYNLYVNVKEPELEDYGTNADGIFEQIKANFNTFTDDVRYGEITTMLDVDAFVRAMLVTDLVRNEELMHPKSWFLYNADYANTDSLWHFGPVWDFDWSFGYERGGHTYFIKEAESDLFYYMSSKNIGFPFYQQLLRGSDKVKKEYYRVWTDFMTSGKLDELIEYCDDYYQYARPSLQNNQNQWGDGNNYATHTANAKTWLRKRANYIYSHLDKYDLSDDIVDPEDDYGQPDHIDIAKEANRLVNVYNLNGVLIRRQVPHSKFAEGLQPGIYIVNGRKIAVGR